MKMAELKLGKAVQITVIRQEYKLHLVSKIEAVYDDHFAVTLIEGNGRKFVFKETDEITVIYKEENRLYKFTKLKGAIEQLDGDYVHTFYGPKEGVSFNRRNAYRVFLGEEGMFSWTASGHEEVLHAYRDRMHEAEGQNLTKGCVCMIKDISENGACICTNEGLNVSDYIGFELMTEMGKIRCIGKIVRASSNREGIYRNIYGVKFTEVSSIITKYVFAVQRQQLKKRKQ